MTHLWNFLREFIQIQACDITQIPVWGNTLCKWSYNPASSKWGEPGSCICKLRENENDGEQERQTAWMNPKPTCQLDSNSPTQQATNPLHQQPRCQLENRTRPAQIHHGPGRCQGEWIHFNAGRYNMFFVFVKSRRKRWTERERERREREAREMKGEAGWERCGWIASGLRERDREEKEGVKEGNGGYVLKNRKPSESTWCTW